MKKTDTTIEPNHFDLNTGEPINIHDLLDIVVEDKNTCKNFFAIFIFDVKNSASPEKLQKELKARGIVPKNIISDIKDYVLQETGHKVYVFDFDKLRAKDIRTIIIKKDMEFYDEEGPIEKGALLMEDYTETIVVGGEDLDAVKRAGNLFQKFGDVEIAFGVIEVK